MDATMMGYQVRKNRAIIKIGFDVLKLAGAKPGQTVRVESNDVPEDAEIVNANYDWLTDTLVVCVESPSLPSTVAGNHLTTLRGPVFVVEDSKEVNFREFL